MNSKNVKKVSDMNESINAKEDRKANFANRIEKSGYKWANRLHKFGVLSIVGFIFYNFYIFGKEYNSHWRARRVNIHY